MNGPAPGPASPACAAHRPATTVAFSVGDEQGGKGAGVRVFAGPRWDPFILDAPAALRTIATGKLAFTEPGAIFLDGKNVLSIVVELDCAQLLGGAELVGVVAETLTRGTLNVRLERAGGPRSRTCCWRRSSSTRSTATWRSATSTTWRTRSTRRRPTWAPTGRG